MGEDKFSLVGWITGEEGSYYEGGTFRISITLPQDYPFKPPRVRLLTKVYHPNFNENGCTGCCS
jgi:ubiquitin-protein ligase